MKGGVSDDECGAEYDHSYCCLDNSSRSLYMKYRSDVDYKFDGAVGEPHSDAQWWDSVVITTSALCYVLHCFHMDIPLAWDRT